MISLLEAKKILGKLADNVSDTDLEQDIQLANLFKNIFFSFYITNRNRKNKDFFSLNKNTLQ